MKNYICFFVFTFLETGLATAQKTAPVTEKAPAKATSAAAEKPVNKGVEEMPGFPGCEDLSDKTKRKQCSSMKMLQYVYENLKYPADAKANKVESKVEKMLISLLICL